jgi:hypothetical protein
MEIDNVVIYQRVEIFNSKYLIFETVQKSKNLTTIVVNNADF